MIHHFWKKNIQLAFSFTINIKMLAISDVNCKKIAGVPSSARFDHFLLLELKEFCKLIVLWNFSVLPEHLIILFINFRTKICLMKVWQPWILRYIFCPIIWTNYLFSVILFNFISIYINFLIKSDFLVAIWIYFEFFSVQF